MSLPPPKAVCQSSAYVKSEGVSKGLYVDLYVKKCVGLEGFNIIIRLTVCCVFVLCWAVGIGKDVKWQVGKMVLDMVIAYF